MAALATPDDMIQRFDARVLGDLVTDTDTRLPPASLPTDPILLMVLDDASATLRAAVGAHGGYPPDEIPTDDPIVVRLVCAVALGYLYDRRSSDVPQGHEAIVSEAAETLDLIRNGAYVFDSDAARRGTLPDNTVIPRGLLARSPLFPQVNEDGSPFV